MPRYSTRPSSQDTFLAAAEKLVSALAAADERAQRVSKPAEPATYSAEDTALLDAVRKHDAEAIAVAIKNGANPNTGGGLPLRISSAEGKFDLMQELVVRGADVAVAIAGLKDMKKALAPPALNRNDAFVRSAVLDLMSVLPGNAARHVGEREISLLLDEIERQRNGGALAGPGAKQTKQIDAAIQRLEDWQASFLKSISPVEILRQQRRILDELAELKREIAPPALDKPKPKLPAPKP